MAKENEIQLQTAEKNGFLVGVVNYNGRKITAQRKTMDKLQERIETLLFRDYQVKDIKFTFPGTMEIKMEMKEIKKSPKNTIPVSSFKGNIADLPMYDNPDEVEVDKYARFLYTKNEHPLAVKIIEINRKFKGIVYISWEMESGHKFTTYVSKDVSHNWATGTTMPYAMYKNLNFRAVKL